ncbi:MAG: 4Fe-4S binding protein [Bryobacterales bacterium]|nr:4Fe-4S binding protein [Bryobacterales bacterium]
MATCPQITERAPARTRKKLLVRRKPGYSQALRRTAQGLFLLLNLWIGVEFYLFVRYYESGGQTMWAARPPGIEGWLPIASLMNLKLWLATGRVPAMHPAGMFLLIGFLAMSWLMRKSFCSWLCPVGTISEKLWEIGRQTFGRNVRLPRWADIPLRGLKYILLGLFLYAVLGMPAAAIRAFLEGPYGIISDVKMLNFFRYLSVTGAVVLGILVLLSFLIQNFWCRYLCPYGALMGLAALLSPVKIRREPDACIDCAKCARECPSLLPVDQLVSIRSAECTACMKCVEICPAEGALYLSLPKRRKVPAWAVAAAVAALFLGAAGYAQWRGYWHTDVPSRVYVELIPRANEYSHP